MTLPNFILRQIELKLQLIEITKGEIAELKKELDAIAHDEIRKVTDES